MHPHRVRERRSRMLRAFSGMIAALVVVTMVASSVQAQTNLNYISVNAGAIRLLNPYTLSGEGLGFVFYPELQVGGDLFTPGLRWIAFWGYADERAHARSGSLWGAYSNHAVGIRVLVIPGQLLQHWGLPIGIFAGAAYHAVRYRVVTRSTWIETANFGPILRSDAPPEHMVALEAGVNVEIRIIGAWGIRVEGRQIIPVAKGIPDAMMENRRSFTGGISYAL